MKKLKEVLLLDAVAQAKLIKKKEIKPIELAEAAIECIEALNPTLNAVITKMYDMALDQINNGEIPDGPFHGVPFLIKDLLAEQKGVRFSEGSAFLDNFVPDEDVEMTKRLKNAGLVILGKTNTPEFGLLPTTEPKFFGPTCNPWDITRTPGGSSGGSAAAVASGMVPMAYANDGGGSIRIPASCCGLFGMKPTRARNPMGPEFYSILAGLFACEHAVTRSVRDSAALLDATSGPFIADPYYAPQPTLPFLEEMTLKPGKLKIAYSTKPTSDVGVHEDCIEAVKSTVNLCQKLGHELVEASPIIDKEDNQQFGYLWSLLPAIVVDYWIQRTGKEPKADHLESMTWAMYEWGKKENVISLSRSLIALQRVSRIVHLFFNDYDVILTPTIAEPPVPLGTFDSTDESPIQGLIRSGSFSPFASLFNITGQPAMSVPLHWNKENLPIGVHFAGRFGDEATLFKLAAQLEEAKPWKNKIPPNHINNI